MTASTRAVSVMNYKGGVGKTTTAVNLAVALAQRGLRVLLIDCDGSSTSATEFLGCADAVTAEGAYGTADFVLGAGEFAPIRDCLVPGLDLLPATTDLAFIERSLYGDVIAGPRRMLQALRRIEPSYDFVVADCAPHFGILTHNALAACPEVLVPVKLAPASATGMFKLRDSLRQLREEVAPNLRILGVLGTFFRARERLSREMLEQLRPIFGQALFETVIHHRVAVEAAAGVGKPIVVLEPQSPGAAQYQQLTQEVLSRGQRT